MRQEKESSSMYLKEIIYNLNEGNRLSKVGLESSIYLQQVFNINQNENQRINIQHALVLIKTPTNTNE